MSNKIKTFFDSILEIITQAKSDILGVRDGLIAQGYDVENVPTSEYGDMVANIHSEGGITVNESYNIENDTLNSVTIDFRGEIVANIPEGVTIISPSVFYNNSLITKVIMPDSVVTICAGNPYPPDRGVFMSCENLKEVVLSRSLKSIGDYTFNSCGSLNNVVIPDGVLTIGVAAFGGCSSLTNIVIPRSVTTFAAGGVFNGCDNLTDVYYKGTQEEWEAITNIEGVSIPETATIHYNYTE